MTTMMVSVLCVSDDSFVVGSSFELLFNIRPRSPTGLLLHVGDFSRSQYGPSVGQYFTLYMLRGEVRPEYTIRHFKEFTFVVFFFFWTDTNPNSK